MFHAAWGLNPRHAGRADMEPRVFSWHKHGLGNIMLLFAGRSLACIVVIAFENENVEFSICQKSHVINAGPLKHQRSPDWNRANDPFFLGKKVVPTYSFFG